MPKSKPDGLQGFRIEFQEREREMLESLVITRSVGNILEGVGAVLAPFGSAFGVIFAALVAKEGTQVFTDFLERDRVNQENDCKRQYAEYFAKMSSPDFQARRKTETAEEWSKRTSAMTEESFVAQCMQKKHEKRSMWWSPTSWAKMFSPAGSLFQFLED